MSETQRQACMQRLSAARTEFKNAIDMIKKSGGDQRGAAIAHTHVDTAYLWARTAADGIPMNEVPVIPVPVIEELPPAVASDSATPAEDSGPAAPVAVGS